MSDGKFRALEGPEIRASEMPEVNAEVSAAGASEMQVPGLPEAEIAVVTSDSPELRTSEIPALCASAVLARRSFDTPEAYEAEALKRSAFEILDDRVWPEDMAKPEDRPWPEGRASETPGNGVPHEDRALEDRAPEMPENRVLLDRAPEGRASAMLEDRVSKLTHGRARNARHENVRGTGKGVGYTTGWDTRVIRDESARDA